MKTLLVTSSVTFVPENYDQLVIGLARVPQIAGVLILDNKDISLATKSLGLDLLGARGMSSSLLRNMFGASNTKRRKHYNAENKPVWMAKSVNDKSVVALIKENNFDLILNARTRCIYQAEVLNAPRLGCINIHHGLLPEQRGTLCDLWALFESKPTGFSIHQMTEKIDQGDILSIVNTSLENEKNYMDYLKRSTLLELDEMVRLLKSIEKIDKLSGMPNIKTQSEGFRKDPNLKQIRQIVKSEMVV